MLKIIQLSTKRFHFFTTISNSLKPLISHQDDDLCGRNIDRVNRGWHWGIEISEKYFPDERGTQARGRRAAVAGSIRGIPLTAFYMQGLNLALRLTKRGAFFKGLVSRCLPKPRPVTVGFIVC